MSVSESQLTTFEDWTLRLRPGAGGSAQVMLLLHGWTGDENSMWVFAPQLPKDALLVAPRAPYVSKHPQLAGYSWVADRGDSFSTEEQFRSVVDSFDRLLSNLAKEFSVELTNASFVGFSQGASFCLAYALRQPEFVPKLAMLAGFIPTNAEIGNKLAGKPIFIAHGTKDQTVPIAKAREARQQLEAAGAKVRYCESDIGHKLGANCFRELGEFFAK